MASCGSFQHIFESPLPESQSLIESLSSWKQIKPVKPIDHSSTKLFGELHFQENPHVSSSSPSSTSLGETLENKNQSSPVSSHSTRSTSDGFSSMNPGSLQLCTEGLGFESLDDVEDLKNDTNNNISRDFNRILSMEKACVRENSTAQMGSFDQYRRSKSCGRTFPPPISCIGRTGKPWVCFKSYRQDGRFVLQEVRIPTQEYLHASREDGRLRLRFVQPESDLTNQVEEENNDGEEDLEEVAEIEENGKSGRDQRQ